ncbi:DNA replication/repair protein RecF [Breznakiella homolactica]|uniref:DNA replication and repair protein RecF n=1 Tax=Breznakiella homolactica TaxID=2798577 RepID=A0A7T7XPB1_9SPIR|nr:DNA replication and repair protein RecF [Breznakiella homolactica]QQO10014.1 DNA replication and repair protein RecF [Breznakiella homolactica]
MLFGALRTYSFRNLADGEINTRGRDVFLVGENGQGKSNFLEAVYFCSYGSSFRGVRDGDLIRNGEKSCSVSGTLSDSLCDSISVKIENSKKTVSMDGKKIADRKEILSVAPSIVFCHEDMEFIAGTPERRRWFFDQSLSLYDPVYLDELRRYRRVLKTRNTVIKDNQGYMIDSLDPQLVSYGLALMEKRRTAAAEFSRIFGPLYEEVAGISGISVRYAPSWKQENQEEALAALYEKRAGDLAFGTTLSGPHRDRYIFSCGGTEFAGKASTGQRRLLALLLRIAQAQRYSDMTGKNPVLLLDDVLLELDPEKRRRFLSVMPGYDQAFYTFLPEEPYERYRRDDTLVYYVNGGILKQSTTPP